LEISVSQQRFASLDELLTLARHESTAHKDYYIGVEHLLLALMRVESGVAAHIFAQQDSSSSYVQLVVQSNSDLDATGFLGSHTPRASRVIARAQGYIAQGMQPDERALLRALLRDSLLVRRLVRSLGVKRKALIEQVDNWRADSAVAIALPPPQVLNNDVRYSLPPDDLIILQQIFRNCSRVVIERLLSAEGNSYSGARVLLIHPFDTHGRGESPAVVKLHDRSSILWEKLRYNQYVRDKLPANTSHIVADVLPENSPIGGLKYSFVQGHFNAQAANLADFARSEPPEIVARLLRERLYDVFRPTWWDQRRSYKFTAWQEYDLLLPPALELEALAEIPRSGRKIVPLHDLLRTEGALHADELVILTDFTVLKTKPERNNTVQLIAGSNAEAINLALRVDVRNFDLSAQPNLRRGTVLRQVAGKVVRTRDDILQGQVLALAPNFDLVGDPLPRHAVFPERLPNPLRHYRELLDALISGSFCAMHGDLHIGNVLIGRNGDAWLIDFEWARDGHTLFDWATLELSLILSLLAPQLPDSWDAAWEALAVLDRLNRACYAQPEALETAFFSAEHPYARALIPILEVRRIVSGLLHRGNWAEYFVPLGLMALRALSWKERPETARRLAYLIVALAIKTSREAHRCYMASPASEGDRTETH